VFSESEKEYLKDCWKSFKERIRWYEIGTLAVQLLIGIILFGKWGILVGWFFNYMCWSVASPAIYPGYSPPDIEYNRTCSAGIEGCKICGNEYSHEFNKEYNDKFLRKWYNF
jgi:hypothetical protein